MSFFSIVVPVYNVEKYLHECVDHILNQSFTDYEIILVDDGSTDGSGRIADEYAAQAQNVQVIHKTNGGLSDARNAGIHAATGEYLIFLDSDDYWADDHFLEQLREKAESGPDLIAFQYQKYYEETGKFEKIGEAWDENINKSDYRKKLIRVMASGNFNISACMKAIKRSFLIEKKLLFWNGYHSEDVEWSMHVFSEMQSMEILNRDAYVYRMHEGSLTHGIRKKQWLDLYTIVDYWAEKYSSMQPNYYTKSILGYLAYEYYILLGHLSILDKDETEDLWKLIKNDKWLMKYSINRKTRLCKILCRVFGIKYGSKVLAVYMERK